MPFILFILLFQLSHPAFSMISNSSVEGEWNTYWKDASSKMPGGKFPYQNCFEQSAKDQDLPLSFLLAVARGESDFNPTAVSKSNALGIMQILWPGTAKDLGFKSKEEVFQPCPNIKAGAKYLSWLLQRYQNNPHKALAAYNYGPGNIAIKNSWIPAGAREYSEYIFSHLEIVLDPKKNQNLEKYSSGKLALVEFNRLFRAKAFVDFLQKKHPKLTLEWFRGKYKKYAVFLTFTTQFQKKQGLKILVKYGF